MKLKYYLRGLGIGMLVAALVLMLSGTTGAKMSDEAVKRRAAELGMVEKDKTVLGDIGSETVSPNDVETITEPAISEEESAAEDTKETEPVGGAAPEENRTEPAVEATPEENAEEQTLAQEIEQRAEEVVDRAEEVAENSVPEKTVTLEVRRGDSSVSVARRAEEAGLVQSAADFDVFLCRNGYDKRISIGSYEVTMGASEKEIADIITKSR